MGHYCYIFHYLMTILIVSVINICGQDSSLTFSPSESVCIGDTVTLTCYVYPPAGEDFSSFAQLSFNDSDPRPIAFINSPANGLTALGYSATGDTSLIPVMGDSARILLTFNSYQLSDNNTAFGCYGEFDNNGSSVLVIQSPSPPSVADPPSSPTNTAVSLSSLSAASCTNTLVSWTAPATTDRPIDTYYVYRNTTLLAVTTETQYTDTDQLSVNTPYEYSVVANSCAGNSSEGVATDYIPGSELSLSPPLFINYSSSASMLLVDWTLKPNPSSPLLLLLYRLSLEYSHSRDSTAYSFSNTTLFPLLSSADTTLSLPLTAHNFSSEDGVETNVSARFRIVQQCGISFYGVELVAEFNSENPPTRPPTTTLPITTPNGTVSNTTASTMSPAPTDNPIPIIAGAVAGGALVLFLLIIILVIIMLCICCGKKSSDSKYPQRSDDHVELAAQSHSTDNIQSEAMYTQVNKPQRGAPPQPDLYSSVHKEAAPQKELLYADLDHVTGNSGRVYPPVAPHTQYTDLAQFPRNDQTLYASVHTDGPN